MASNSRVMLFTVLAGGAIAIAWATSRSKAAAAAPLDPLIEPPGPPIPPQLPAAESSDPPEPSLPAPTPDPMVEPPGPPIPVAVNPPPASLDPMIEPPGPPIPHKPFGDTPLEVDAGPDNRVPPPAPVPVVVAPAPSSPGAPPPTPVVVLPAAPLPKPPPPPLLASPPAPKPVGPVARTPKKAAQDLLEYVSPILKARRGSELGTKGAPNAFVRAAQTDMGVKPDGIYGPDTRTKGKQLLGVTFPARV